jgi:hypothetical protein
MPRCGSPGGGRMASLSTTIATARNRPHCAAWCSNTLRPSSPRAEDAAGADLPQVVNDEFDTLLDCGIPVHSFLRLHCGDSARTRWSRSAGSGASFGRHAAPGA